MLVLPGCIAWLRIFCKFKFLMSVQSAQQTPSQALPPALQLVNLLPPTLAFSPHGGLTTSVVVNFYMNTSRHADVSWKRRRLRDHAPTSGAGILFVVNSRLLSMPRALGDARCQDDTGDIGCMLHTAPKAPVPLLPLPRKKRKLFQNRSIHFQRAKTTAVDLRIVGISNALLKKSTPLPVKPSQASQVTLTTTTHLPPNNHPTSSSPGCPNFCAKASSTPCPAFLYLLQPRPRRWWWWRT